jgi:hypothetical protein
MARAGDNAELLKRLESILTGDSRSHADIRQLTRLLVASAHLAEGPSSSLDVKLASSAVEEMGRAFEMFAPYRGVRKVTIFGSARTTPDNPIYDVTVRTAAALADAGFMVLTGAGPGIMEAGMVGAGRERSIGVSIRLPFEQGANSVIAGDSKFVSMRYFFTRKLMLVKESSAFLCLPCGFGTLDETFELLTLAQTAKTVPVPIVLLEIPGQPFWTPLMAAMEPLLVDHGLISPNDTTLYRITDQVDVAIDEITHFYNNYHSIRFVNDRMYIRMQRAIPSDSFDELSKRLSYLAVDGVLEQIGPTPEEVIDDDVVALPRIGLSYGFNGYADLRVLIDAINEF